MRSSKALCFSRDSFRWEDFPSPAGKGARHRAECYAIEVGEVPLSMIEKIASHAPGRMRENVILEMCLTNRNGNPTRRTRVRKAKRTTGM